MSAPLGRLRRHVPAQYLWPVLLLLGTCFGCILALLFSTTSSQDVLQAQRERQTLSDALAMSSKLTLRDLRDYAQWDDAVRHIARHLDVEWMIDNVAHYLGINQGYTYVFVLDDRDRTSFLFTGERRATGEAQALLGKEFSSAVTALREFPAGRDLALSGFTRQGDLLFVFSTVAIVPLTGKVEPTPGPPHLLVLADVVDADYLREIADDHKLQALALRLTPPAASEESVAISGRDGQPLAWLTWAPARPGSVVRRQVLPTIVAITLLGLFTAVLILRRGGRTIEALKQSEARARHHADHDPLTGLPNRRALVGRITTGLAEGARVALLYMDLDGFKDANDVYGHATGDVLLREAAARIAAAAGDGLVARAGGDEFAVLLRDVDDAAVAVVAEAILTAFRRPFAIGAYSVTVGISVGSALLGGGEAGGDDELMRRADVAMYAAKADGKDCWRGYDEGMDRGHHLRLRMEADLRAAVDAGDISIVFQPIIGAATGEIVAVEALSRWRHPVHGDVPPDIFIPLAEMSGLISALGRHVLTRACNETRDLAQAVAVNLSPAQFWDRNLASDIRLVLAETGFPADRLELEITENFLLRRPDAAAAVIDDLRRTGIRIALDDFGTGFASIGYLRQLSFDRLKIDKSFIRPLAEDAQAAELVASIVALAQALGLEITAEGVETEAQARIARFAGCTRLQGWLYGQPMTAERIRALCAAEVLRAPQSAGR